MSKVLRSDNLSAATYDLRRSRERALTRCELLDHYGLQASLIQVGEVHENGVVEQAHRRTKSMLSQALLLRGSCDFGSVEDYEHWVRAVVEREHNSTLGERLLEERRHLEALPAAPIPAYTALTARVRRWRRKNKGLNPITVDDDGGQVKPLTLVTNRNCRDRQK